MKVKSESEGQSCPTLHDPMDCSLPGSSAHGISQAGVLEWGAIALQSEPPANQHCESLNVRDKLQLQVVAISEMVEDIV